MKTYTFLLLSFALFFVSCEKDNPNPTEPTSKFLKIVPTIENRPETKAGVVKGFKSEDKIGLFVTGTNTSYNNIPAEFTGTEWELKEITDAKSIQAYFPYSPEYESVEAVPVNIQEQTDYLYSLPTNVSGNVARLNMKHPMSLVSIVIEKNDYNYEGKVTQLQIEGIPSQGEVNLKTGETKITGEPVTYKKTLNYMLDSYNPEKISTIVLPAAVADMGEVTFRVIIDEVGYSFSVPQSHIWEAGKEYTYTLSVYKTFKPDVLEVIPVDVSYWNTYGKTDKITILDKPNQNLWFQTWNSLGGRMTIKGEGQIFGGRITNKASTDWEGQWRYGMFDMAGNLVELYQPYNITIPAKNYDGGEIPCFIDCPPGKYQALPLLRDKGSNYWYIPRLQFEGMNEFTVLPNSANTTPSLRSIKVEGWYEAYPGTALFDLNQPFEVILTITNRAGVALKGEIKAMRERNLSSDFIAHPLDYLISSGYNTEEWADEIGRIYIDYSSDVKIKQEQIICTLTTDRKYYEIWNPTVRFYYRAEGTSEWILMRCDFDHQFEKLKGILDFGEPSASLPTESSLRRIAALSPATNYTHVNIKK